LVSSLRVRIMDEDKVGYEPETTSDDMSRSDARLAAIAREKSGVQSRAALTPPMPQGATNGMGSTAEAVPAAATAVVVPPWPDVGRHVTLTRKNVRALGCDHEAGGRILLVRLTAALSGHMDRWLTEKPGSPARDESC